MKMQLVSSSTTRKTLKSIFFPIIFVSHFLSSYSQADSAGERDTIYFTLPPSPEVLASHLFGVSEARPLTRSLSFKDSNASEQTEKERSVTMPILFYFGKTTITSDSKPFLDNVGKMLVAPENLVKRLVVEGHTDSIGSSNYNFTLSERRARAIKEYLVSNFGVHPDRLTTVGKGESFLYNQQNPTSAENRRVEFLPLTHS